MTAPSRARRHAANVEVMRLNSIRDMSRAQGWMNDHGVWSRLDFLAQNTTLWIHGANGVRLPAILGQVLTYDPTTGEFAVLDAAVYDKTHTAAQGVAE